MSTRSQARDVWVGLIVIIAVAGLLALVSMASDGPGFLAPHRTIDVVFRDAQGIHIGSTVRVAGLDTGNVVDIDVVEVEGMLRARVKISLPAALVKKLRQDVKVSIQPALTGMSHVNVMSTGRSSVALVPGQSIPGVETSLFDPIIEQVGLGPAERNHLSHTIAEVRQQIDSVGPRIQQVLGSLQETTSNLRELSESIRPAVESTVGHVEDMTRKLNEKAPEFEKILTHVEGVTREAEGYLVDNRETVKQDASLRAGDVAGSINPIVARDLPKLEKLIDGAETSRARADRLLYQADQIAGQVSTMLAHNRAEVERSVTNVRDATDWASKIMQKIFTNPFVLSPFYKPNHEDLRVGTVYDMVVVYTKGASDLHDSVKTLEAMSSQPATPQQQNELRQIQQKVQVVSEQMSDLYTRRRRV